MTEYVYPQDGLPEMGYTESKVAHPCATCGHSHVTNRGAYIPGFHCRLMEKMFAEAGIENGMTCVNCYFGTCKLHTALFGRVRADAEIGAFADDEGEADTPSGGKT